MSDDTGPISLRLTTSDDEDLEAEWQCPTVPPSAAVVLAHPHPAQGGNMRSLVTSELFRSLPALGVAVLRFNGLATQNNINEHVETLMQRVAARGERAIGPVTYAFYNPPWTLPWARRNEVMIELARG